LCGDSFLSQIKDIAHFSLKKGVIFCLPKKKQEEKNALSKINFLYTKKLMRFV